MGGGACSSSPATQSAINDATNAGATVVVAAGNDAADAAGFIPASCNNVITVAASDFRGRLVTRYSNFGSSVEILAPGGDLGRDDDGDGRPDGVLSTVQGGYAFYNGTSMASPHVAGAAALLLAREPGLTPQQVSDRIQANARTRNSTQCPRACGAGLLNANFAAPSPPPPPPPSPLQVDLAPATVSVDPGATAAVTATVSRAGAAVAGESVRFASSDTGIATIAPATAQSDAGGVARATVSGVARGTVTITATAQGASDTSTVEVPFLAGLALLVLLAALFFMGYRYQRRTA